MKKKKHKGLCDPKHHPLFSCGNYAPCRAVKLEFQALLKNHKVYNSYKMSSSTGIINMVHCHWNLNNRVGQGARQDKAFIIVILVLSSMDWSICQTKYIRYGLKSYSLKKPQTRKNKYNYLPLNVKAKILCKIKFQWKYFCKSDAPLWWSLEVARNHYQAQISPHLHVVWI